MYEAYINRMKKKDILGVFNYLQTLKYTLNEKNK
jgi:hypothetical protein